MTFISDRISIHANKAIKMGEATVGKPEVNGVAFYKVAPDSKEIQVAFRALEDAKRGLENYAKNHTRIGALISRLCGDTKKLDRINKLLQNMREASQPVAPPAVPQQAPVQPLVQQQPSNIIPKAVQPQAVQPQVVQPQAVQPPVKAVSKNSTIHGKLVLVQIQRCMDALDKIELSDAETAEKLVIAFTSGTLRVVSSQLRVIKAQLSAKSEAPKTDGEILVEIGAIAPLKAAKEKCLSYNFSPEFCEKVEKMFDDFFKAAT